MDISSFENKLERQLELEKIVSTIAKEFVKFRNVDLAINKALLIIGKFCNASRAYIFEFDKNDISMSNIYEWCNTNINSEIENLKKLPLSMFPWWIDKIKTGEILDIHDVASLGISAKAEKEILEMQGIKSVLVLPIIYRDKLRGFVGFDNVETKGIWKEEDISILNLASELFSNVFERILSENELTIINKELENTIISLKSAQTQLFQQEHMVAIGQLAAGIAHEINNPLGFVISNQNTLEKYFEDLVSIVSTKELIEPEYSEYSFIKDDLESIMSDINIGLNRVKKIVKGLRFFSRVDRFDDFELYDLNEGIENTLIVLNYKLGQNITVIKNYQKDLPSVMANGSKINQVILNILVNAVDAVEEKPKPHDGVINIETTLDGKHLNFIVKDNGIGISESVKKQMFNPFFTTKAVGKGTGLGLNIVYDIIKNLHLGEVLINSVSGHGAEIIIKLPVDLEKLNLK